MFTTIAEVKEVARHIWPQATDFYVTLLNPRHPTSEGYRITAVGGNNRVLGNKTARTLSDLKTMLEQELTER